MVTFLRLPAVCARVFIVVGPFWPMWDEVFTEGRTLTAFDIAQKYGDKNVCFRKAAIGILGDERVC